jgi:hypothetical protein
MIDLGPSCSPLLRTQSAIPDTAVSSNSDPLATLDREVGVCASRHPARAVDRVRAVVLGHVASILTTGATVVPDTTSLRDCPSYPLAAKVKGYVPSRR